MIAGRSNEAGRAASRVESILDATAILIDSVGDDHVSTTLVAEMAHTSIGSVYRYFPNRLGLLEAVHDRNAHAVRDRIERALARPHSSWEEALVTIFECVVRAQREIAGMHSPRRSTWWQADGRGWAACVARSLPPARALVTTQAFEQAVWLLDGLTRAAFDEARDGEPGRLDLALEVALLQLGSANVPRHRV